mmetsp:Transcript_20438/g.30982  ORF Transcript_20438/g.30982 Transcript_20438/m.30982 type:complete len:86 (+) Transcript_20438:239-496(+)
MLANIISTMNAKKTNRLAFSFIAFGDITIIFNSNLSTSNPRLKRGCSHHCPESRQLMKDAMKPSPTNKAMMIRHQRPKQSEKTCL